MGATGDDVDHRQRQQRLVPHCRDQPVERDALGTGGGQCGRDRYCQHGIGAGRTQVGGAVGGPRRGIDRRAVEGIEASRGVGENRGGVRYGALHALPGIAGAAVAQLARFVAAGRGPGGDVGLPARTPGEQHLAPHCGFAA